jgi:Flp pilus assembly protein TadB
MGRERIEAYSALDVVTWSGNDDECHEVRRAPRGPRAAALVVVALVVVALVVVALVVVALVVVALVVVSAGQRRRGA